MSGNDERASGNVICRCGLSKFWIVREGTHLKWGEAFRNTLFCYNVDPVYVAEFGRWNKASNLSVEETILKMSYMVCSPCRRTATEQEFEMMKRMFGRENT